MNELPFAVLFKALEHNYDTYINNVWATLGLLLLFLSFITSKRSTTFTKKTNAFLLLVLIFTFVIHIFVLHHYFYKSELLLYLIQSNTGNDFMQNIDYFKIKYHYIILSLLLNGSVYFIVGWFLYNNLNKGEGKWDNGQ